jgi:hypothetical protein
MLSAFFLLLKQEQHLISFPHIRGGDLIKKILLECQRDIRKDNHVINRYCNHMVVLLLLPQGSDP